MAAKFRWILCVVIFFMVLTLAGCGVSYRTPGAGADVAGLFEAADEEIKEIVAREAASPLPVNLIVVRLQDRGYHSYSMKDAVSLGRYSIVMTRDIEDEADFERINKFPQLEQVGTLNRILLPAEIRTDKDLRVSAAKLHADMLLLYTVDTKFWSEDSAKPLSVVTLGFSPTVNVHMISTISGVLMDVRTGYVYGAIEATEKQTQLSSWWANEDTIDQSRLRVEQIAFDKMLDEFERLWIGVVAERKAVLNMQQKQ